MAVNGSEKEDILRRLNRIEGEDKEERLKQLGKAEDSLQVWQEFREPGVNCAHRATA